MFGEAKRRSSRRVVPVLVALMGSLLLGPAVPVTGVDGEVDHPADYSACVGPAAESAGFPDMVGSSAESAADCLAHYGITKGTSAGTFSPSSVIPRWQMALFLVRAAGPAGITVPEASDQGFTDLDRVGANTRDAINQLAALGIMKGDATGSTFSPFADVTRRQMALLLSRFLEVAPTGPGGSDIEKIDPDDGVFRDIRQVTVTTHKAIRKLYELGVTVGTSTTTFSPDRRVTRGRMAVFVTRMLAHTNARPAGLTIQTATPEVFKRSDVRLSISLRDSRHQPLEDEAVDVFTASDPTKAFDKEGVCTDHVLPAVGGQSCTIDGSDKSTDPSGNLSIDVEVGDVDGLRIWAWTGGSDDTFDEDATDPEVLDITTRSSASAMEVSDDLPPTAQKVRFGDSVTFTFRLVDDDGDPVLKPGVGFTLRIEESRDNGRSFERTTISKETGPDGEAQVTFGYADPSGDPGDLARLDLDLQSTVGNLKVSDATTIGMVEDGGRNDDPFLDWADEAEKPTTIKLSVTREYQTASSAGDGSAATVRATLTDQYGGPVARERIVFTSSDSAGVPHGSRRTTNSRGVATLNYLRDSSDSVTERITGKFGRLVATARQYWVESVSGSANGSGEVRVIDTDTNTVVVVGTNDAIIIEYDDNDHYYVGTTAITVSAFEGNLTVGDTLAYEITDTSETTRNSFTLTNR